jgi:SAM-dependent methyltransferase
MSKISPSLRHTYDLFPWLRRRFGGTEYLAPEYYAALLRPYCFAGVSDLELFKMFLTEVINQKSPKRVLELGSGPGRATDVYLDTYRGEPRILELIDQSAQMLDASMHKYGVRDDIKYVHSDIVRYLLNSPDRYDLIFSLWSFSHSVHQTLVTEGEVMGRQTVAEAITRLCESKLTKGGCFFLIHFDALSEEQEISLSVRRLKYPFFVSGAQSPSKQILDETLMRLSDRGIVNFELQHLPGDPIAFSSIDDALEVFFNFHMECEFNDRPDILRLIDLVKGELKRLTTSAGVIEIKPGCFVYKVTRLN